MTDAGRALLVNAICYIARFTEDRPIVRAPFDTVTGGRAFDRDAIARFLADPERELKQLDWYVSNDAKLAGKSRQEVAEWYRPVRGYLHAARDGRLTVDREAQRFGVPPNSAEFLGKAIDALGDADRAPLARTLLRRYVPGGPGGDAPVETWRAWEKANGPYLFFSDAGGYHWYLDPLAQRRNVPTARLRGPARATRPVIAKEMR